MDLLISLMERLDVAAMVVSAPVNLTEKIVMNVLSPARLVLSVLTPGLSSSQTITVRTKTSHLLVLILGNLDTFIAGLLKENKTNLLTEAQSGLAKLYNRIEILELWELLPQLLDDKQMEAVIHIIRITKYWVKMFGVGSIEGDQ